MRGGGSVGSIVASQQDGPWFESRLSQDANCVEFACSSRVCMGFPHNPKTCCIGDLDKGNWP